MLRIRASGKSKDLQVKDGDESKTSRRERKKKPNESIDKKQPMIREEKTMQGREGLKTRHDKKDTEKDMARQDKKRQNKTREK